MVRTCLEADFADVWLEGELSNLRAPGSGHLYCTLKDSASQIRAVLFRSTALRLGFGLEDGLHVIVRGRVTVYEPRGEYQIVLEHVEPKGRGAQQLAFEQLKRRLGAEGLFDRDRKKPLPVLPRTVGLVTSPTGAAVRDMIAVLHRRCPILHIILSPVSVQGDGAAEQIVGAIEALNELGSVDVIIVGRGGGSFEDLQAFNDERVVRAIAGSSILVVSAVGHETDVTLADFAADLRAPTPSAAAEAVTPVLSEIVDRLAGWVARCHQGVKRRCDRERQRMYAVRADLGSFRFRVLEAIQRVDDIVIRMRQTVQRDLRNRWERTRSLTHDAVARSPGARVRHGMTLMARLTARLEQTMRARLNRRVQAAHSCAARLHSLSPTAVLDRGYSVIETMPGGEVLRDARQAAVGQAVVARLAKGSLCCRVTEIVPESPVNRDGIHCHGTFFSERIDGGRREV